MPLCWIKTAGGGRRQDSNQRGGEARQTDGRRRAGARFGYTPAPFRYYRGDPSNTGLRTPALASVKNEKTS